MPRAQDCRRSMRANASADGNADEGDEDEKDEDEDDDDGSDDQPSG